MEYINYIPNYIPEDKMTYSWKAIRECVEAAKKFDWSAPRKKQDFWNREIELELLYRFLYNKTECWLFEPDEYNYYFWNFFKMVSVYKDATRKELASALKQNELYIKSEIKSIWNMMCNGEVNTVA